MNSAVPNWFVYFGLVVSVVGLINAAYLAYEKYSPAQFVTCPLSSQSSLVNCSAVAQSSYSEIYNIPVAFLGLAYYIFLTILFIFAFKKGDPFWLLPTLFFSTLLGFVFSVWLVYVQVFLIGAICTFCLFSFFLSFLLFVNDLVLSFRSGIKAAPVALENPLK